MATLALGAAGCATWHATDQTPLQVFTEDRPAKVRVTTSSAGPTVLSRPRILGNVVAGFDEACLQTYGSDSAASCEETGFAVHEITVFEIYRRGPAAYILPAVGGLAAAWLLANR